MDAASIQSIMKKATVCRLAMVDGDTPYVVPLCFGYRDNTLYFHGACKGRKIDLLRANPNVCFEIDIIAEPMEAETPCDWSMRYQSVVGFGKAVFIEDAEEKRAALNVIMAQYSDKAFTYPDTMLAATAVIKVAIDRMTGKQSGL